MRKHNYKAQQLAPQQGPRGVSPAWRFGKRLEREGRDPGDPGKGLNGVGASTAWEDPGKGWESLKESSLFPNSGKIQPKLPKGPCSLPSAAARAWAHTDHGPGGSRDYVGLTAGQLRVLPSCWAWWGG